MKRGIISIILTLVLALGPAASVAAEVTADSTVLLMQTGEEAPDPATDPADETEDGLSEEGEGSEEGKEEVTPRGGEEDPQEGQEEVTPKEGEEDKPSEEEVAPKEEEDKPAEEEEVTPKEDEDKPAEEEEVTPKEEEDKPAEEEVTPKEEEDKPSEEEEVTPKEEEDKPSEEEVTPKEEEEKDPSEKEEVNPKEEEDKPSEEEKEPTKEKEKEEDVDPDEETADEDPEVFSYTIIFDGNGATGGAMKEQVCEEGVAYALTGNAFVRTGYEFDRWNTKPDGTGTSYQDKEKIKDLATRPVKLTAKTKASKDKAAKAKAGEGVFVTLYAQWKETPYPITYILDGGTNDASNPAIYTITTEAVTLKAPVKQYNVFEGWYADAAFTVKTTGVPKGSTGEKKFYAKWREFTYTINYDGNKATSGTVTPTAGVKYSQTISLKANKFKKKGYKFISWNTKKRGTGTGYAAKEQVSSLVRTDGGQITLYAQWALEDYRIKYHLKGGKNNPDNPKTYTIKTRTFKLKTPTKRGFTFLGWYKDSACTKKITTIKKGRKGDIDVYAKWKVNRYTVEFEGNGSTDGRMKIMKCRYGKEYILRANKFKRTGYTFMNWNRKKRGTGKTFEDQESFTNWSSKNGGVIKLYAQWNPIKYKVKFDGNGAKSGSMKRISCVYDVDFELPKCKFKRDGYSFKGWSTEDDGSGHHYDDEERVKNLTDKEDEIVTLYARWEYDSDDDEATIWNFLSDKIGNDYGAAGVMGNLYAESGLRSNNLENMYNERYGISDEEYTRQVDSGEYGNFTNDSAGYGIAQWTFPTRKQGLLEFARSWGTSISNLRMQLEYLWKELTETYGGLLESLRSAGNVREASDRFMTIFENPADQSEGAKQRRAGFGWNFFSKFH
ncbi:MAG: InlB B-repeat-containing protein [Lachnospiraceae bacterium]|nr:InlB B-repeat-containing protein [Lachnospiraceae bacterium]